MKRSSMIPRLTLPAAAAAMSGWMSLCAPLHAEELPQGFLPAVAPREIAGRAASSPISDIQPPAARSGPVVDRTQPQPPLNPQPGPPVPPDGGDAPPAQNPTAARDDRPPRQDGGGRIGRNTPPPSMVAADHPVDNAYGASKAQKMYAAPPPDYGNSEQKMDPLGEEAFEAVLKRMAPMSDDQIRKERSHLDSRDRVMSEPANGVIPTPHSGTISLSLKPGEDPPRIGLAPGNATVLTFYDQTGAPWPITSVTSGNSDAFATTKAGQNGKTNMAVIAPKASYGYGNLVVTLEGLPVPVIFSVVNGSGVVDYRKDIRIRGRGPNAQEDITEGSSLQPANDKVINEFLDDLPPKGAVAVKTSNPDVEAWRYKHLLYVRSHMIMAAPDYVQDHKSPEGSRAYAIDEYTLRGSPVLQFLVDGRSVYVDLDLGDIE